MGFKLNSLPEHVQRAIAADDAKKGMKKPMRRLSLRRQAHAAEELAFRLCVRNRDGDVCVWCGQEPASEVHHISGRYPLILNNHLNGIHLGFKCHERVPNEHDVFMAWLAEHRPEQYRFAMEQKKSEIDGVIIVLPLPADELSPNARVHWAELAEAKKKARRLAEAVTLQATSHLMQSPQWEKATFQITAYYNVHRDRDDDNLTASCKAYRDGIADAGIIQNDSGFEQLKPVLIIDKEAKPRIEITIKRI